ncbi:MAG: hypothetical protein KDC95_03920 [Planctomycetes bacterium]|nr:hypothetical protein [Planctomycetota bacterium]
MSDRSTISSSLILAPLLLAPLLTVSCIYQLPQYPAQTRGSEAYGIRTRSLTIVDEQDRPRITMTVEDDSMGSDNVVISTFDSQGGLRGSMSLFHDTFPLLQLNGARGEGNDDKERIVLSFDAGGDMPSIPSLSFYDHEDVLRHRITSNDCEHSDQTREKR